VASPGPPVLIKERGLRDSSFGEVLQLKVWADGYPDLRWEQIQEAFSAAYPGRYAVQLFPPASRVVNGKAVYHLWVLPEAPRGVDLREQE